ncbi:MAG: DUF2891 domain-containing protein [Flavobacteriia bacterium]|jgi:hypothetical protein
MKNLVILTLIALTFNSCQTEKEQKVTKDYTFKTQEANRLAALPCKCLNQEYPNKLGQVLNDSNELLSPKTLHPVFYGCFDWHSAVHGHWLLVKLAKQFPDLKNRDSILQILDNQFDSKKIEQEIAFFKTKNNESFERTYGWAWIFKLQEELNIWKNPQAQKWAKNLSPLTELLSEKLITFLPKLVYPIRTGEHPNTAFALSFAYDFAEQTKDKELMQTVQKSAKSFYLIDKNYQFDYEPSGYDFLSPGFQEIDVMRKVLPKQEFLSWLEKFHPQLFLKSFDLNVGKIKDRTDGKLVHLDGLNFSRAWCLYELARCDKKLTHLKTVADKHFDYSIKNIVDGDYMGEHWLASFATYAIFKKRNQ